MPRLLLTLALAATAAAQAPLRTAGATDTVTFAATAVQATIGKGTLVAQCTRDTTHTTLDIFLYSEPLTSLPYEPPYRPKLGVHPRHVNLALTAVGYRTSKIGKRQFEVVPDPTPHFHYLPPSMHSANLADFPTLLPWFRSLPTLRITSDELTADFLTTPVLDFLHTDPTCAPLGL